MIIETDLFTDYMVHCDSAAKNQMEKRKLKYDLLDSIVSGLGDKWSRLKEGSRRVYDMACFLGAERGFFYAGSEYLAEYGEIGERTVQYRMKEIIDLGLVVRVNRRCKKSNGRGKAVYLFVNHPYFQKWVDLLGLDVPGGALHCVTVEVASPCPSREESPKKVSTYCLPLKQEKYSNSFYNDFMKFCDYQARDIMKKNISVQYMGSYVKKCIRVIENRALAAAAIEKSARRRRAQEEARLEFLAATGRAPAPIPFYNWLES